MRRQFGTLLLTAILFAVLILGCVCTPLLTHTRVFIEGNGEERIDKVIESFDEGNRLIVVDRLEKKDLNYLIDRVYDDPGLFWIDMRYNALSVGSVSIVAVYEKYDNVEAKQNAIEAAASSVIKSVITKDMTEYEKVLAIHDWICKNVTYKATDNASDQDIYGALILGEARCAGYAKLFSYLLNMAGIESSVVSGNSIDKNGETVPHAWNVVYIDDNAYYFDITWDDDDIKGHTYEWFGISKDEFKMAHFPNIGYEWVETNSDAACYYVKNGMYMKEFGIDVLSNQFLKQGNKIIIKCATKSVLNKVIKALNDEGQMLSVMRTVGIDRIEKISYSENKYTNCLYIEIMQ